MRCHLLLPSDIPGHLALWFALLAVKAHSFGTSLPYLPCQTVKKKKKACVCAIHAYFLMISVLIFPLRTCPMRFPLLPSTDILAEPSLLCTQMAVKAYLLVLPCPTFPSRLGFRVNPNPLRSCPMRFYLQPSKYIPMSLPMACPLSCRGLLGSTLPRVHYQAYITGFRV
jgi:hypothetical protein